MVKTGVIGIGSMGKNHARVYSEISELAGVCDVNKEAAEELLIALEHFVEIP